MGAIEKSPETRGAKTDPSYVLMAEYIAQHIGEPTLTVGFSQGADMETLQEEVEMARQKIGRYNVPRTAIERQTPSHLHGARYVHRRRA